MPNKKRISFILLITTVIVIWGIILFRITTHFLDNDDIQIDIANESLPLHPVAVNKKLDEPEEIGYITLEQDPFTFSDIIKPEKKIAAKKNKIKPLPPVETINYSIKGVIIANSGKMIIFNDESNSKTLFLREGEEYKYIKILKIDTKTVLLTEYKISKEVNIN